jgi:heme-degrading monooxygenase HmoA
MYARLVSFHLQPGKQSVATELAQDMIPDIARHPGFQSATCFGDAESGQFHLYVLWNSEEEADAAAVTMGPRLTHHLAGNTTAPPDRNLYPVIYSA